MLGGWIYSLIVHLDFPAERSAAPSLPPILCPSFAPKPEMSGEPSYGPQNKTIDAAKN
jgi:hypothetical protein